MLEKAFAAVDLFGIPILLNFSKSQKAKSAFGGFCSLLFLGFVLWSIYNSGYELFARQKPQIIDGTIFSATPRPIQVSSNTLPVAFGIKTNDSLMDSKYCQYIYFLEGAQETALPMEKCTPEHFSTETESISEFQLYDYYCLPFFSEPKEAAYVSVYAFCSAGDNTAEFLYKSPTAILIYPKNGLTLHDYENPLQLYFDYDYVPIVADTLIVSNWIVSHLDVTTDDGWLTTNEKVREYIQMANDLNRNLPTTGVAGIGYVFSVGKQESYYLRSYKRLQNVLAEVGGIASTVFTALSIIVMPYARIKFSESFVNELFEIKRKKRQKAIATQFSSGKNNLAQNPKNNNNQKVLDKSQLVNRNNMQGIKLKKKDTSSRRVLKTEGITIEREPRFDLSINLRKSPDQSENEGLLRKKRQDEKQSHLQKPRVDADSLERIQLPYRKIQTQPIQSVPWQEFEDSEQDDKLILPYESQKEFKSEDKSTANANEKKQVIREQQNDFKPDSASPKEEEAVAEESYHYQHKNHEVFEIAKQPVEPEIPRELAKKVSKPKRAKREKVLSIKISLLEYCWSFVSRSAPLKEKMVILNQGIKIFDERLDIFNLLKKLRDVDKMKGLLLDKEQLYLFDRTSRPDILDRVNHWYKEEFLSYESYDVKSGSVDEKMRSVEQVIQDKPKKSEIDEKLLSIISDSIS